MANYQNGGRNAPVDEHRPSWRPQDQSAAPSNRPRHNEDDHDHSSWRERNEPVERDPRRWEGSRGSELGTAERDRSQTEYYGQGQSGYSAGRYGEDRAHQGGMQNRNEMWSPAPGAIEARQHDPGTDDRWSGRGGRHDRSFDNERSWRGGTQDQQYQGGYRQGDQHRGGHDQSNGQRYDRQGAGNYGGNPDRMARMNEMGPYDPRMGYQGGYDPRGASQQMGYTGPAYVGPGEHQGSGWSPSQHGVNEAQGPQRHTHRGNGPHRGKGPQGYQRSDERIRELVCDALADDDQIDASQIQVTVKDGEVTLTGTVDNRRIRREAEDCVASVSGVRDVQVQLRVRDDQQRQAQSSATSAPTAAVGNGKLESDPGSLSSSAQDKKHRA